MVTTPLAACTATEDEARDTTSGSFESTRSSTLELLEVARPQLTAARARLRDAVAELVRRAGGTASELPFDPATVVDMLVRPLLGQMWVLLHRTMILELNVARLEGRLTGGNSAERYSAFITHLERPEVRAALQTEYPVMERLITEECDRWVTRSSEFLGHLVADWSLLLPLLRSSSGRGHDRDDSAAGDQLVDIEAGVGDRHRGGRTVLVLRFASGRKVVYKPRSLEAERRFQQLVRWLNAKGCRPRLRPLRLVSRGDHGWVEYLEPRECGTRSGVHRYFQRQGIYLALLYLLGATDMHYENILACGEHPMLIDLEALFHQRLPDAPRNVISAGLSTSVVAVRLLPQAAYVAGIDAPVDFSGLGATPGGETPFRATRWEGAGTDEMCCTTATACLPEGRHLPRFAGRTCGLLAHAAAFRDGFESAYGLLQRHRRELLSRRGPIWDFAGVETRFIPRPSQTYAIVLEQGYHPDSLRCESDREACFARLSVRARQFPSLERLMPAERRDLCRGDLPYFTARPSSRHIWTSDGQRIDNFFAVPALEEGLGRVRGLSRSDRRRQLWLIDASLAMAGAPAMGRRAAQQEIAGDTPSRARTPAVEIGERLMELAWRQGDRAGWLTLVQGERGWSLGPLGLDLAHGLAGVIVTLAMLGHVTGRDDFRRLARAATRTLLDRWREALRGTEVEPPCAQVCHQTARVFDLLATMWSQPMLSGWAGALRRRAVVPDSSAETGTPAAPAERRGAQFVGCEVPDLAGGLAGQLHDWLQIGWPETVPVLCRLVAN